MKEPHTQLAGQGGSDLRTAALTSIPVEIQWLEGNISSAQGAVLLSRWLRGGLTKRHCSAALQGGQSCADRADPTQRHQHRCERAAACAADWAFPQAGAPQHRTATVLVRPASDRALGCVGATQRAELVLLGSTAPVRLLSALSEVTMALTQPRGPLARTPPVRAVALGVPRSWRLQEAAAQWQGVQRWRVNLHTPWVLEKRAGNQSLARASDALQRFAQHVAQRAYKLASLLAAEGMQQKNHAPPNGALAHQMALRAREACAAALSCLQVTEVHVNMVQWSDHSASTAQVLQPMGLEGGFTLQVRPGPTALTDASTAGPWLAMMQVMGLGEGTAEGFGSAAVQPA